MLLGRNGAPMAEDYIRKAAIDFCTKTQINHRTRDWINLVQDWILLILKNVTVVSIQEACGHEVLSKEPCTRTE